MQVQCSRDKSQISERQESPRQLHGRQKMSMLAQQGRGMPLTCVVQLLDDGARLRVVWAEGLGDACRPAPAVAATPAAAAHGSAVAAAVAERRWLGGLGLWLVCPGVCAVGFNVGHTCRLKTGRGGMGGQTVGGGGPAGGGCSRPIGQRAHRRLEHRTAEARASPRSLLPRPRLVSARNA